MEQTYRKNGVSYRPVLASIGVTSRGTSKCLDRVLIDFGADDAFKKSSTKVKEHYGIDVSASSIRNRSLEIAAEIAAMKPADSPAEKQEAIIA